MKYKDAVNCMDCIELPVIKNKSNGFGGEFRMSINFVVENLTFNELMTKLKHTDKSWADGL